MRLQFARPHRNAAYRTTGRIGLELLLAWKQNMFKSAAEDVPLMLDSLQSISYSLCNKIIPDGHKRRTTRLTPPHRDAQKIITFFRLVEELETNLMSLIMFITLNICSTCFEH